MANATQDLKDETLAQLEALRSTLTSDAWQIQMMSASAEQQQQNSDVRILASARIAQLEDVQFAQIQEQIDVNAPQLNDAIAGVQDALTNLQEVGKVLAAATTFLKVVGKVLAAIAL
jgi:hypothetical protein